MKQHALTLLTLMAGIESADAFSSVQRKITVPCARCVESPPQGSVSTAQLSRQFRSTELFSSENDDPLGENFGGFTAKQRLREEIESPFRQVRLFFFAFGVASASVALYFSAFSALKANMGGFSDVPPLEEALKTCAINLGGVLVMGTLALREYNLGQDNLRRIAKGGLLARLQIEPVVESLDEKRSTMKDYRRTSRVIIAAGGKQYINNLALSLCADQLADENSLPSALAGVDIIVVPVLLRDDFTIDESTKSAWSNAQPGPDDRNFDSSRANDIICFPKSLGMWKEYLSSDIETASGQGFNVLEKGITVTVKKNGRILRRATGLPPFGDYIGTMEVADGAAFGMPGDSEKYGGP